MKKKINRKFSQIDRNSRGICFILVKLTWISLGPSLSRQERPCPECTLQHPQTARSYTESAISGHFPDPAPLLCSHTCVRNQRLYVTLQVQPWFWPLHTKLDVLLSCHATAWCFSDRREKSVWSAETYHRHLSQRLAYRGPRGGGVHSDLPSPAELWSPTETGVFVWIAQVNLNLGLAPSFHPSYWPETKWRHHGDGLC